VWQVFHLKKPAIGSFPADLETLDHLFQDTGLFRTLHDFGYSERLQEAILAWDIGKSG
jgi:hypothetical protein